MLEEFPEFVTAIVELIRTADPMIRAQLEARILGNQPQGGIAVTMGIPREAVALYETRYFPFREFLGDASRIWGEAIIGMPDDVLDPRDVCRYWRNAAYVHGILFLDWVLNVSDRKTLEVHGLMAYLGHRVNLPPEFKIVIAQACCPLLRTSEGLALTGRLANQEDWKKKLPPGERVSGVFAKVVALFRAAVLERKRSDARVDDTDA